MCERLDRISIDLGSARAGTTSKSNVRPMSLRKEEPALPHAPQPPCDRELPATIDIQHTPPLASTLTGTVCPPSKTLLCQVYPPSTECP
ncbi:hypothetical protein MHYP_G00163760 [Metynnis hypsauchen]